MFLLVQQIMILEQDKVNYIYTLLEYSILYFTERVIIFEPLIGFHLYRI